MKIRRYKGHSLEKLYDAIQNELGPEAVVISTSQPKGVSAMLPPVLGGRPYELIAVVDDHAADRHLLDHTESSSHLKRLSKFEATKWEQMESNVDALRADISNMMTKGARTSAAVAELPEFAETWDPEFIRQVDQVDPRALLDDDIEASREAVKKCVRVEENFPAKQRQGPHVIVLVGPTGSGKTTTLAKLAAHWSLEEKMKVGLITTDTFRIAAVDQIKEYATLLGLDLRISFSAGEAARAARSFTDKDIILVDTPGRNHYDHTGLAGLRGVLGGMGSVTVMMLLPATMDRRNVKEVLDNFQMLSCNYLVVTKIDETKHFDVITALEAHSRCPIAFMTNGQRVPQDLMAARLNKVVDMLVPEEKG